MKVLNRMVAAAVLLTAPWIAIAGESIGQVKSVTGSVVIVRDGISLTNLQGAPVYTTDRVMTGADSSVGITFNDDSLLSLGPNSEMDISHFAYGTGRMTDGMEARLNYGTLAAVSGQITKARPEAMKVRTPTTILGVRGTQFYVQVASN